MLHKIIYLVFIINTLTSVSYGIHVSEFNETKLFHSMNSQISELRAEQKHHDKLIEGIFKALDLQLLKDEQERQGKLIDGLVKATDVQSLKAELEKLKKDGVEKQSDIELFKEQLEQQKTDGVKRESSIQLLKTELEQLKTDGVDKESKIHFLAAELERQGKLIGDLNMQLNNQSLREHERQEKLIDALIEKSYPRCTVAKSSGIHEILITNFSSQPFKVSCDAETQGGGWTIILRRMDGTIDFYRNWAAYKEGFGDLNGEFFLGLDKIHALTEERNQELLVVLEDNKGNAAIEMYDKFAIGDEDQQYVLHTLGSATGDAGDSLSYHGGMKFTTKDRDNDNHESQNCAVNYTGAWWYNWCHDSNLAGKYNDNSYAKGVSWNTFKGDGHSLKKAVMMIRPKK
ncbi:fibrinogen-like protein 1 [Drosophila innubila]|uniref:fibrinogen-like protein 1 n=1 Tax=Drosophila innubila TaxID=198719 RepID=UPI00148C6039|nr:fibrinogen-like protein 1 [Drosophila innubila]